MLLEYDIVRLHAISDRGNPLSMDQRPCAAPGHDRVHDALLSDIVTGARPAGSRLVAARLAEELQVSRTPVREALIRLQREGFAQGDHNKGFAVAPLDEALARQIYPMVGALEGLAIIESGPLIKAQLPELRSANRAFAAARWDPRAAMAADQAFHRALLALCPNRRLMETLASLHHQTRRFEAIFMSEPGLIDTSVDQHEAIIAALDAGDLGAAEQAVRANYAAGLAAVLVKIRAGGTRLDPTQGARA